MVELRPYQVAAEKALREACARHREVILVMPTGAGKSKQAAAMAAAKGRRVIIAVPKIELVRQSVAALAEEGITAGIIAAGVPEMPESPRPGRLDRDPYPAATARALGSMAARSAGGR